MKASYVHQKAGHRIRLILSFCFGLCGIVTGSTALAAVLHVPGEYATIQAAINAAIDGDTVDIAADSGIYTENLLVNGKNNLNLNTIGGVIIEPFDSTKSTITVKNSSFVSIQRLAIRGAPASNDGTIRLEDAPGFAISYCTVGTQTYPNKMWGILVIRSGGGAILHTTVAYATYGIQIGYSGVSNTMVIEDTAVHHCSDTGIRILESTGGQLQRNTVTDCGIGLDLSRSPNYILRNNDLSASEVNLSLSGSNTLPGLDLDTTNTVDGKPVYVFKGSVGGSAPLNAGFVILYQCTNTSAANLVLSHVNPGIWLEECTNCLVDQVNVSHTLQGVTISGGSQNRVSNSSISPRQNSWGISLWYSPNSQLTANTITGDGISVNYANGTTISQNNITGGGISANNSNSLIVSGNSVREYNGYGLNLSGVKSSTISGNTLAANRTGLSIESCDGSTFSGNVMTGNLRNLDVQSGSGLASLTVTDTNTVEGKPVIWWKNQSQAIVPPNAGFVALINCTDITVQNLELKKNNPGILLLDTVQSHLQNLTIAGYDYGLWLMGGSANVVQGCAIGDGIFHGLLLERGATGGPANNTFTSNRIQANQGFGIFIDSSAGGNRFYLNSLVANKIQIRTTVATNDFFTSPTLIPYQYKGKAYTDQLGNFYSDYTGPDVDSNGLGDTPYAIWGSSTPDDHPLLWDPAPPLMKFSTFLPAVQR